MKHVVIVGGGIAGLSAAYDLHKAGCRVTVVERERLGGVILTERVRDHLIEGGPDSFITTKPWAKELCEEIGLGDELVSPRSRGVHVLSGGTDPQGNQAAGQSIGSVYTRFRGTNHPATGMPTYALLTERDPAVLSACVE